MKKQIEIFIALMILFTSCASKPVNKNIELVGMIIDENNNPVNEYIVHCENEFFEKQSVLTNENGLFVFSNVGLGNYTLSGEKNGYSKMNIEKYSLKDDSKILCCQVSSCEYVLKNVLQRKKINDYEECINLLNEIYCDENSFEKKVVQYYKNFFLMKQNYGG